ncbi:histidine phosphatase family protein [Kangiella sp. TOML190]|uniref:SixA phosphatase family protein n=1 Tax=Kangiella sp. TOML190 TaxID=2931351 RepID=UPI0020405728|nr:histidine phosphatase family protein [Kangiella sp. TOML190]
MTAKKLYIMRHGKSDWNSNFNRDFDRPLAERGVNAASLIGKHLAVIEQLPELVISSSAKRTLNTIEIAMAEGNWNSQLKSSRQLYLATTEEAIALIKSTSDAINKLMLVAHEPMCSSLIAELAMGAHVKFPTAAVARLNLKIPSWQQLEECYGRLDWLLTPKALAKH